jgi:hypothetical protein
MSDTRRRHDGRRRRTDVETRDVAPLRESDKDGIGRPFRGVIQIQAGAEPRSFDPGDRVGPGIEAVASPQDFGAKRVVLQVVCAAVDGFLNQEPQQLARAPGGPKDVALEHSLELLRDCGRRNLRGIH